MPYRRKSLRPKRPELQWGHSPARAWIWVLHGAIVGGTGVVVVTHSNDFVVESGKADFWGRIHGIRRASLAS